MNLLGIDFEEWFHPELIQHTLGSEKKVFKVVNGLDKILELLNKRETYATFFVVGEILKEFPEILDKILEDGHEIGFHTMYHSRLDSDGFKNSFENELKEFEKLTHKKSKGFRAPTFSLNENSSWAIDLLEEYNYTFDSSIVPAKSNMYGNPKAPKNPYLISSTSLDSHNHEAVITEFPLMVTKFLGKTVPSGGGFYLRTLPFRTTKNTITNYEKQGIPGVFYIHSWELTPEYMPKLKLPRKDSFITYHNLDKAMTRMDDLLSNFQFTSFERYIQKNL